METRDDGLGTRAIHAGSAPAEHGGAVVTPIYQSAMFLFEGAEGEELRYLRYGNTPNQRALNAKLAALENAEAALVTASGMGAISGALFSVLRPGDHVLFQEQLYGGTHRLATRELPEAGIEVGFVDATDPASWSAALRPNTKAFYLESQSNPLLSVPELEAAADFAHAHGLVSMIDNTFPSPMFFRPAEWGFDLSLHSATKYLNGHSDVVAGAVVGAREHVERVAERLAAVGGAPDAHQCFLLDRGLRTLGVRMRQHETNGRAVAELLAEHAAVTRVYWPGLADSPDRERAERFFDGVSGMVAFELAGGAAAVSELLARLRLFLVAPSLGGVESLVSVPVRASHTGLSREERERLGITDGLVRLSVGIEDTEDLVADLTQGLPD